MAGERWAEKLIGGFKLKSAEFAKAVETRVLAELKGECHWPYSNERVKGFHRCYKKNPESSATRCDYEPKGLLVEAINEVFPDAENTQYRLRDILPQKHELLVFPDRLKAMEGYGNWIEEVFVTIDVDAKIDEPTTIEVNDAQDQSNAM